MILSIIKNCNTDNIVNSILNSLIQQGSEHFFPLKRFTGLLRYALLVGIWPVATMEPAERSEWSGGGK